MRFAQRYLGFIFCLLTLAALNAPAFSQQAVPVLRARVTDLTGTLPQAWIAATETKLAELEREKGSQIAVLLIASTEPEAIEQYSIRVAENWKLGRKGVDDGVLFLVAKNDRKMRIEVGYGLEGALNDATCKRIIDEIVKPHFKQNDFPGGLSAGLEAIIKVVSGEALPPPPNAEISKLAASTIFGFLLPLAVFIFIIVQLSRANFSTGYRSRESLGGWSIGGSSSSGGGFSGGGGSFGGGGASGGW